METKIMKITGESLALAKNIMLNHGVVAFPTETVYGLGAIATDPVAVSKIYEVKGRPGDNPLIAHVHKDYDITRLVKVNEDYVEDLKKAFLPGPLTMVYDSLGVVCKEATAGGDTLAVRVPSHKGAQRFLKYIDAPVVAPSANVSKHVSPVTAGQVYNDLNGKIELILDGGRCNVGIESTVLDVTADVPRILRPGYVTKEDVERIVGACEIAEHKEGDRVKSPGVKYKHYSPNCKTALFSEEQTDEILRLYKKTEKEGKKPYVLCEKKVADELGVKNVLNLGETPEEMAKNLYNLLLDGEKKADIIIGVEPKDKSGILLGVVNRLSKACRSD